jgi:hypothetical protein
MFIYLSVYRSSDIDRFHCTSDEHSAVSFHVITFPCISCHISCHLIAFPVISCPVTQAVSATGRRRIRATYRRMEGGGRSVNEAPPSGRRMRNANTCGLRLFTCDVYMCTCMLCYTVNCVCVHPHTPYTIHHTPPYPQCVHCPTGWTPCVCGREFGGKRVGLRHGRGKRHRRRSGGQSVSQLVGWSTCLRM